MMVKSKTLSKMEVMKRAMKYYGDIIEFIPHNQIDEDMCKLAIRS